MVSPLGGTEGSNPLSSSGESATNRELQGMKSLRRDRWFESGSLHRGVRNEPVPQRPQNYGAKRFTSDKQNWGYQLRFGLFEISDVDMTRLTAM